MPRGTDRYDEAARQGRLWTPNELRGAGKLARWYKAIEVDCDGSAGISPFRDLSGRGSNATQATAGSRPVFTVGSYRRPYALYATTERYNSFSSVTYGGANGVSWAGVAFWSTSNSNTIIGGSGSGQLQLRFESTGQVGLLRRAQANLATSTASLAVNTLGIVGCDVSTSSSAVWLNGVATATATDPGVSDGGSNIGTGSGSEFLRGGVFEVLCSEKRWGQLERFLVDGYLAWQNYLVGSLPSSHPFKNRPPLIGD